MALPTHGLNLFQGRPRRIMDERPGYSDRRREEYVKKALARVAAETGDAGSSSAPAQQVWQWY